MGNNKAETLNNHLANGGVVVLSNHLSRTIYTNKHAGVFWVGKKTGNLYVRRGKTSDCLTACGGEMNLVSIQMFDRNPF